MNHRVLLAIVLLAGIALRVHDAHHGVDGTILHNFAWRECDTAMVARNFIRDGMNPLYPQVDFCGDQPGYVESELPILPWAMAIVGRLGGPYEVAGRFIDALVAIGTLLLFHRLVKRKLGATASLAATAFFALSPLPVGLATSLQPDGFMLLFCVAGVDAFDRYLDSRSWRALLVAAACSSLAILAKGTAIHLGLLYLALIVARDGFSTLLAPRTWALGVLSVLPGALWYAHARGFYRDYGNSLGISTEHHFAGLDVFTNPYFVFGILKSQVQFVWMPAALPLVLHGFVRADFEQGQSARRFAALWWLATLGFFLIAARTCADEWAYYYHVISAPAAAILVGIGIASIGDAYPESQRRLSSFIAGCTVAGAAMALASEFVADRFGKTAMLGILSATSALLVIVLVLRPVVDPLPPPEKQIQRGLLALLLVLAAVTYLRLGHRIGRTLGEARMETLHTDAMAMAAEVASAPKIAVTVESRFDPDGYPVDAAASYMFYWLDKKGFLVAEEDLTLEYIDSLRAHGVTRLVAERRHLAAVSGIETALEQRYRVLEAGAATLLFDLASPK